MAVKTTRIKYTPNEQYILKLLFVLFGLSFATFILRISIFQFFSTCSYSPYGRGSNPDTLGTAYFSRFLRDSISFGIPRTILLITAYRIFVSTSRKKNVLVTLFCLISSYFVTLYLLETVKFASNDNECHSSHGNAISGHGFYVTWTIINITYFLQIMQREIALSGKRPNIFEELLISTRYLGTLSVLLQVFFTYYYGYHSIQQIFLGGIVAIGHCIVMIIASEYVLLNNK